MIIVNFKNHTTKTAYGLWQWDYGQVLRIEGLDLPTATEVHFSTQETGGESVTRIGMTKDCVTDVVIPDSLLENNGIATNYFIYAFIYITDATSGQTEYVAKLEVKSRPKPEAFDTPGDGELFREAIKAVNNSADRAETAANTSEQNAEKTAEDRTAIAEMVETVSGIEQQVQDVKKYAGQAKTAASNAALSEQKAKESETAALQAKEDAETAKGSAETAAGKTAEDRTAVESAKEEVLQAKQQVSTNRAAVEAVERKVAQMGNAIPQAVQAGVQAVGSAGAAEKQGIVQAGTEQKSDVESAGTKAVEDINLAKKTATDAVETAKTGAIKAVEDKGAEVLQSIPEDFTTQMASKLDKQQGAENKGKALVVGNDGNVTVGEVQGGDGIPIINTMSGESPLVVPDSAERVNKGFSLIGNMEQLQTTGAQLFDISKISAVNVAVDKDMIIVKVYSSNTGITAEQFMEMTGLKPGDKFSISYTFEGAITDSTGGAIFLGASKNLNVMNGGQTGSLKNTVILPSDFGSEYGSLYFFGNKSGANCYIKNFMINKGESVKPYEPYTGGKPSPSPDYPQEIKNVGKWNEEKQKYEVDVIRSGRNTFDVNNYVNSVKKISESEFRVENMWGTTIGEINLKAGREYRCSFTFEIDDVTNSDCGVRVKCTNKSGNVKYVFDLPRMSGYVCTSTSVATIPSDTIKCELVLYTDVRREKGGIFKDLIIAEENKNALLNIYEPYRNSQTLTLTSDRPITKWDKLVEQDGQIGWLYGSKNVKLSGTETYNMLKRGDMYSLFTIFGAGIESTTSADAFCNYLKKIITYDNEGFIVGQDNNGIYCYLKTEMFPEANALQNFMTQKNNEGSPAVIYYKSNELQFVPLPQSEQDAIRALKTYYPTTVITTDGGEVNPDVEVSYIADTKNYIDQKIAAIGKTVVETQKALL